MLNISDYLDKTAAYLIAIGLFFMAMSYILAHLINEIGERQNRR